MSAKWTHVVCGLLLLMGCKARQQKPTPPPPPPLPAAMAPQEPAPTYPYQPSADKDFDLIHTELRVSFDWQREEMAGEAVLTMRPWFLPKQQLVLDAKGFVLHKVALQHDGQSTDLHYTYDNARIAIDLGRAYARGETLQVRIDYTARPWVLDSLVGGSAAEDQGLYFVNPRGETAGKPRQIWTQGESHGSPGWFPTFDNPNQRCTQETYITVADSFVTLGNGVLASSRHNPDGTRTDHWKMDLPHAPYLFMMAIGKYAVVKDEWRGREVSYYVEPEYAPYARLVFGETPAMIEFFSQRLGVDYPWPKYSQVVVRDFVSGAMENTTATIHYGRLQHNSREHLDDPQEDIIAHELFHQWFGDLVTCESWANLSLNEGFATYGEYLWIEHRHGRDAALASLLADRSSYLRQASRSKHPIIHYHHSDADAMFDAHSYQKGGQVLHMLRNQVGDEVFFAALKRYLDTNAFDDVEIHELRLAFEEVSGQDLNWFFDQWYLQAGHPELSLEHSYANGQYRLHIRQLQDPARFPVFRLPIAVDYVVGPHHKRLEAWMQTGDTTFVFEVDGPPSHIAFNPDATLLCELKKVEGIGIEEWLHQAVNGECYPQRVEAMQHLKASDLSTEQHAQLLVLASDPYHGNRRLALDSLEGYTDLQALSVLPVAMRLLGDPKSSVRTDAVRFFATYAYMVQGPQREQAVTALKQAVRDSSYLVGSAALSALYAIDHGHGLAMAEQLMDSRERHLSAGIAEILRNADSPKALPFILARLEDKDAGFAVKTSLLRGFGSWLGKRTEAEQARGLEVLFRVAAQDRERWVRFFAIQALGDLKDRPAVKQFFEERLQSETDEFVRSVLQRFAK